jgi:biopolymer transport protein ExbB/TolQ
MVGAFGADMGLLPDYNPEPHQSLMVRAQDFDRNMLNKQEQAKKAFIQARNTGKAITQPFDRTKDWVKKQVDTILAEDEDKRKARMLEDKNYRTMVRKVFRVATDLGLYTLAFAIGPTVGFLGLGKGALDFANSTREKKEVQKDLITEIEIIDDKIKRANEKGDHKAKYELMRIRRKMLEKATNVTSNMLQKAQPLHPMNRNGYDYDYPW